MPNAKDLTERARMFEERAERASDPFSASTTKKWRPIIACYQSSIRKQRSQNTRIVALTFAATVATLSDGGSRCTTPPERNMIPRRRCLLALGFKSPARLCRRIAILDTLMGVLGARVMHCIVGLCLWLSSQTQPPKASAFSPALGPLLYDRHEV